MYKLKYMCGMKIVRTEEVKDLSDAIQKVLDMETGTSAYILDDRDNMIFWRDMSRNGIAENLEPAAKKEIEKIAEDFDIDEE